MKGMGKKAALIGASILAILLVSVLWMPSGDSDSDSDDEESMNLSVEVEQYRSAVILYAESFDMGRYVDLILCVMEVESHGNGNDPMQASEGGYNKKYPRIPNGIQDPYYSIECGIQELKAAIIKADVADEKDYARIKIALAGYNFGPAYIDWIKSHGNVWTLETSYTYSKRMAQQMGWKGYGDPEYANKVMRYYNSREMISGTGDFIPPLESYVFTSDYGARPAIGDFHYGVDTSGGYGANIYAPIAGTVYMVSNSCPPDGGYLGNMCPYSQIYGGGNYVMIKTEYQSETYYVFMCHMKRAIVYEGMEVMQGQKIGEQGHSGNSTGTHVHLEIRKNTIVGSPNGAVDPNTLIDFEK